jgi:hypothetical protein
MIMRRGWTWTWLWSVLARVSLSLSVPGFGTTSEEGFSGIVLARDKPAPFYSIYTLYSYSHRIPLVASDWTVEQLSERLTCRLLVCRGMRIVTDIDIWPERRWAPSMTMVRFSWTMVPCPLSPVPVPGPRHRQSP